ncbi:hypothetical protein QTP86_023782 [Hemibagrus guttatus]|nr:hypothetical protein QTP86_023782 [Hemibagrus guttatus]
MKRRWLSSPVLLLLYVHCTCAMFIPNATHLEAMMEKYIDKEDSWWESRPRGKRAISHGDMQLILDLHNKLRGQVYPPASNMEYMVRSNNKSYTILSSSSKHRVRSELEVTFVPVSLGEGGVAFVPERGMAFVSEGGVAFVPVNLGEVGVAFVPVNLGQGDMAFMPEGSVVFMPVSLGEGGVAFVPEGGVAFVPVSLDEGGVAFVPEGGVAVVPEGGVVFVPVNLDEGGVALFVWDTELERSAEDWSYACLWQHGPSHLLTQIGQNLGVHWGRERPPTFHVQAWYDEVQHFSFPYPQECNPYCPYRCSGPVCTHYTQLVWATSNKIGCAINMCYNMNVWGMIWAKAVYLVCNYSPPGNWFGHAPYKHGRPCSACPSSYGGGCRDNLCYKDDGSQRYSAPEPEESNYIEPEPSLSHSSPSADHSHTPTQAPTSPQNQGLDRNEIISTEQMSQQVECDVKLRDRCKGTTCNRYECPPGCLYHHGKVMGTGYYDVQSSICGAALHAGIIDDDGGWLDITRVGRRTRFTKSYQNGVQTQAKEQSANAFTVLKVPVKAISCDMTVSEYCPFKKPVTHCPRLYCPRNCLDSSRGRVIGTRYYADSSSICRAAIHAGVIQNDSGGYLDVMPVDKRRSYRGSQQNRVTSQSLQNPTGGKAFRVFAVI